MNEIMKQDVQSSVCEGFLLVDKPSGMTSAYCLERIKHALQSKTKVGHGGTLDSFATGLLVVGLGRQATREFSQVMRLDKQYEAMGKLGQLTDTLDFTGTTLQDMPAEHIRYQDLEQAIRALGTEYHQIPPLYSALKYQGKHLSKLVRSQRFSQEELDAIAIEKGRDIHIYNCTLTTYEPPFFSITAHVSHGTYVRCLVNDIAKQLESCATTHSLRRTAIGPFSVTEAKTLAQLNSPESIEAACIPVDRFIERLAAYAQTRQL